MVGEARGEGRQRGGAVMGSTAGEVPWTVTQASGPGQGKVGEREAMRSTATDPAGASQIQVFPPSPPRMLQCALGGRCQAAASGTAAITASHNSLP